MHGGSGSFQWKHAGTMAEAYDYIHLFLSRMKENVLILCTATKYIEYKLLHTLVILPIVYVLELNILLIFYSDCIPKCEMI